jgi:hypothetical protein
MPFPTRDTGFLITSAVRPELPLLFRFSLGAPSPSLVLFLSSVRRTSPPPQATVSPCPRIPLPSAASGWPCTALRVILTGRGSFEGRNRLWRAFFVGGCRMSEKRRNRPWTTLELERLEELRGQGRSYPEIAAILGRTVSSVASQGYLYGFWRRYRLGEWLRVLRKRHTLASAAAVMGTSIAGARSAKRRLRAEGYKVPRGNGKRRPRPKPIEATLEVWVKGQPLAGRLFPNGKC